jgi:5'-phosphate synthase pdxT subunit
VLGEEPFHGIFIRAPIILSVGPKAEILASHDGNPILVRQNNIIGATFHPELADDTRFHKWFFSL